MDSAITFAVGAFIGAVLGFLLCVSCVTEVLDSYAKVSRTASGFYVEFEGKAYQLIER